MMSCAQNAAEADLLQCSRLPPKVMMVLKKSVALQCESSQKKYAEDKRKNAS